MKDLKQTTQHRVTMPGHKAAPTGVAIFTTLLMIAAIGLAPGCGSKSSKDGFEAHQPNPEVGATEFVSAGLPPGTVAGTGTVATDGGSLATGAPEPAVEGSGEEGGQGLAGGGTVVEGDIFRLLDASTLLNLNQWRGLQVIDLSDPDDPTMLGGLRVDGHPVEMYAFDDRAVVLMNSWHGYYGGVDTAFAKVEGGVVLLVDLSDPSAPAVLDHKTTGGDIQKSRLVTDGENNVVYVVSTVWPTYEPTPGGGGMTEPAVSVAVGPGGWSGDQVVVTSFAVNTDGLEAKSELDLGGWISDIQATPSALMVARTQWTDNEQVGTVALVDISDPSGAMEMGADIEVAGIVESQFGMDLRGDVLRVASQGDWWWNEQASEMTNHVETFDVSDLADPKPIDSATFGDEEQLYATIFLEDRAFFVTYFVQDPFHAFEITAEGDIIEHAEFVVSGWNDFFKPALGDTRLLGVGVNDEDGPRDLAVSLYDTTDLDSPDPLVQRVDLELDGGWSEANWDHRAFTVVDDALEGNPSEGPNAEEETGLVLLPYSGWNDNGYLSGVQILTFSASSLTARGTLNHDSPVRRSFPVAEGVAASISETSLGTHDISDPDAPETLGTLPLAPSYADLLLVGDAYARLETTTDYWWYGDCPEDGAWQLDLLSKEGNPDTAKPLASLDVPTGASVASLGTTVVATGSVYDSDAGSFTTRFTLYDVSDPSAPVETATLDTDEIVEYKDYYGGGREPMPTPDMAGEWACEVYWYGGPPPGQAVGDALVFTTSESHQEELGELQVCVTRPGEGWGGSGSSGGGSSGSGAPAPTSTPASPPPDDATEPPDEGGGEEGEDHGDDDDAPAQKGDDPESEDEEIWYSGEIYCVTPEGGGEFCQGSLYACTQDDCEPVDAEEIETWTDCWTDNQSRWWQSYSFHVLDASDPAAPAIGEPIVMPEEHEATGTLAEGSTLWVGHREVFDVEDDDRPYFKYFVTALDLSDPSSPALGEPINVPGQLLFAEGSTLYTQDQVYADTFVESALSRVTVTGGVATLESYHRFEGRVVDTMALDGAGHAIVAHRDALAGGYGYGYAYDGYGYYGYGGDPVQVSILDAETLKVLGTMDVDAWASLRGAAGGLALFQVPGGLLSVNLSDAADPQPQAYFPTQGWPDKLRVDGTRVLVPAGRYGVYDFDLEASNLLQPE